MKQESSKKNKKLIWLIAGLAALLVVLGVVLAIFIMPGSQQGETGPVGGRPDLYWNVDRQTYIGDETSAGLSTREPAEDGLYHIRFSYNGELVEYTFADKRMVNVIDNMDVMALVKDAEGNVIDALAPDTVATEVAKSFFVQRKDGSSLMLNSSIAMNGMQMPIEICELTQIYNVDVTAEVPGQIGELDMMDKLLVYANDKGEVTHIYIIERQPAAEVYWRVGKYYDSTNKTTTREPDENGVYTLTFAKDGKHVELKCKDKAIVDNIDSKGVRYNAPKGLQLDEEGYIVGEVDPAVALRGKLAGSEYHVTEMNGNEITATYLLSGKANGKSFTVTVPDDCPVYNVCVGGSATLIGEPTEMQMYDRIICYTDLEGKPILIYVMYRMANVPMYWNINRMYDSTKGETTRVPVNGYYVFKMAVGGKQVTLRTKDWEIANQIDSLSYMCGLEVEGDIIKKVYKPVYVSGNDVYGAGGTRFLISQTGVILSFVNSGSGNFNSPLNLVMRSDVEIYDVTGYAGTTVGEPTTLNEGDSFRMVADYNNNITHIYVTARYTGKPIYYNISRQYNATKEVTKRTPNAEGYYVYEMASQGKTVTVKTKDQSIANYIDKQNAPIVALDVRGDIVRAAYPAATSLKFGYKTANYHRFEKMNGDGTMSAIVESTGISYTFKVAEDVKIYNCAEVYEKNRGEQVSSLQYWDQIQGVATMTDGTIKEIYVMKRQAESKFYYNPNRKYNSTTNETTREPNEEGYYVYELLVDGERKEFKTKDRAIASLVDSFNYVPFGMKLSGNIIKGAFSATSIKGVKAIGASSYDVMGISSTTLNLTCYQPSASNRGKSVELPLASNYKAYNVSSYAETIGARCKLAKGDRLICYTNMDGEVEWAFVWYKNTHQKGYISYCEHCGKNVYWQPYSGNTYSGYEDVHLYLPADRKISQEDHGKSGMSDSERTEAILDLNGYTMSPSSTRSFLVYSDLVILDTVGGGKISGGKAGSSANGGAIMIGKGGNVTLLSGTLTQDPESLSNKKGGVIWLADGGTFNMKGGVIEGGTATQGGGNIYIDNATFNMTGGTIKGDILVAKSEAKINIGGKANITMGSEYGLRLVEGVTLPLGDVTAETKVVVDAAGVFTKKSANIDSYLNNFVPSTPEIPIVVQDSALAGGLLRHCQHCDKNVYFTRYAPSGFFGASHMVVVEDMVMPHQVVIGSSSRHTDDVVIDLNSHTITTTKIQGDTGDSATGRFALVYAKLSILDNSAAGNGKITTDFSSTRYAGLIMGNTGGIINLYGGELTHNEGVVIDSSGGIIALTGYKKADDGTVKPGSVLNMYGGVISNGTARNGGNIAISSNSTVNMYAGVIKDGSTMQPTVEVKTTDKETGEVTAYTYSNATGGNIYMSASAVLNVGTESGAEAIITGGKARAGGNIYMYSSTKSMVNIEKTGVVSNGSTMDHRGNELDKAFHAGNIYNGGTVTVKGKVSGGQAWGGGNFVVSGSCKLIVDGGIVENGVAAGYPGGNVYTNNGIIELKNGAVMTGGESKKSFGGNISAASGSEIYIDNSVVSDGVARLTGGNIHHAGRRESKKVNDETVMVDDLGIISLTNGAQVTGGESNGHGGNIYTEGGVVKIENSTVSNGVGNYGGNIYAMAMEIKEDPENKDKISEYRAADITITDSEILNGTSRSTSEYGGGGNIYTKRSNYTIVGTLVSNGTSGECGGNLLSTNSTVTLGKGTVFEGGTIITDDDHSHMGSNICRFDSGKLYIQEGALVTGGEGTNGEVYSSDSSKSGGGFIISGEVQGKVRVGTSTVNEVNSGKIVGNLSVESSAVVTLNGDAQIDYISGKPIVMGELTENAKIIVSISGVFTNVDAEKAQAYADAGYFEAKDPDLGVVVWEDALLTGVAKYCEHCKETVLWSAFDPTKTSYTSSGHFVVKEDAYMSKEFGVNTAKTDFDIDVVIDLNGKTIETKIRFALSYAKLSILDSSEGKTGKIIGNVKDATFNGGLIGTSTGSVTNIYGGTLTLAEGAYAGSGGIVWVTGTAAQPGTFNVYGGTITGGVAKSNGSADKHARGGNIWIDSNGIVNLYGGTIENGFAEAGVKTTSSEGVTTVTGYVQGLGGNIALRKESSKLNVYEGATISGGKARHGGNIYISNPAVVTIEGGTIKDGEAVTYELTQQEGTNPATVTGYDYGCGGNIYNYGTLTMTGGVVQEGKAARGGNIYVASGKDSSNKTIGGKTTLTKGTVQLGKALAVEGKEGNGGNIYVASSGVAGALTVDTQSVVSGGYADNSGGNIYAGYSATILGTVSNGTAVKNGGNIYTSATVTVGKSDASAAAEIKDGTAANGGNIYAGWALNVYPGTTVSNGTATTGNGGNIYINCGNQLSSGKVSKAIVHQIQGTVTGGKALNNDKTVHYEYIEAADDKKDSIKVGFGGNIYKTGNSLLNIGKEDGTVETLITLGQAVTAGNIYLAGGKTAVKNQAEPAAATTPGLNIYKGAMVSKGSASNGGNIGLSGNTMTCVYGTVTEGTATANGGNITVDGGSVLCLDGGTISNGTATVGANIYGAKDSVINVLSGTLPDGVFNADSN